MSLFNECFWKPLVCFVDDFPPSTPDKDWTKLDLGLVLYFTSKQICFHLFIWFLFKVTTVLSIVIDIISFWMRNYLSFSSGGGGERERERERETYCGKNIFKYSLGKKDNARIPLIPNQKILNFSQSREEMLFFLNFAGLCLKDRLVFYVREKMVVTTISSFFPNLFRNLQSQISPFTLSPANALNAKIRWTFYAVSQPSFLS